MHMLKLCAIIEPPGVHFAGNPSTVALLINNPNALFANYYRIYLRGVSTKSHVNVTEYQPVVWEMLCQEPQHLWLTTTSRFPNCTQYSHALLQEQLSPNHIYPVIDAY
jgi:hypothetical protein